MISPMPSIATGSQAADAGRPRRRSVVGPAERVWSADTELLLSTSAVSKDRPPGQLWQAASHNHCRGRAGCSIRPRRAPTAHRSAQGRSFMERETAARSGGVPLAFPVGRVALVSLPGRAKHLEQSGGDLPIEHLVAKLAQCFIQLPVAVSWRPSVGLRLIGFRQAMISRRSGFRRHPSDLDAQARDILASPTTRRQSACCGLMARLC